MTASAVILGCWCAAGLASLLCLFGLLVAPTLVLLVAMVSALATALGGALMLLPHGTRILAVHAAISPAGLPCNALPIWCSPSVEAYCRVQPGNLQVKMASWICSHCASSVD